MSDVKFPAHHLQGNMYPRINSLTRYSGSTQITAAFPVYGGGNLESLIAIFIGSSPSNGNGVSETGSRMEELTR